MEAPDTEIRVQEAQSEWEPHFEVEETAIAFSQVRQKSG
jgi:hypothetical protein